MFRKLFQAIFGSFFLKQRRFTEDEVKLIQRMIDEANAIADGTYLTESKLPSGRSLPSPVIPERRKHPR